MIAKLLSRYFTNNWSLTRMNLYLYVDENNVTQRSQFSINSVRVCRVYAVNLIIYLVYHM